MNSLRRDVLVTTRILSSPDTLDCPAVVEFSVFPTLSFIFLVIVILLSQARMVTATMQLAEYLISVVVHASDSVV